MFKLVGIDTWLARCHKFSKFWFWRPFLIFSENTVSHQLPKLSTDFVDLKKSKYATMIVAQPKHTKWPQWRHQIWIFKIWVKGTQQTRWRACYTDLTSVQCLIRKKLFYLASNRKHLVCLYCPIQESNRGLLAWVADITRLPRHLNWLSVIQTHFE